MSEGSSLRHRQTRTESSADVLDNEYTQDDEHVESVYQNPVRISRFLFYFLKPHLLQKNRNRYELLLETYKGSVLVVSILTVLAFALRFYKINHPDPVV